MNKVYHFHTEKTRRIEAVICLLSAYAALLSILNDPKFFLLGKIGFITTLCSVTYSLYYKEKLRDNAFLFAGILLFTPLVASFTPIELLSASTTTAIYLLFFALVFQSTFLGCFGIYAYSGETSILVSAFIAIKLLAYLYKKYVKNAEWLTKKAGR
ncbi:MAG: hypothetical protein VXW87_04565 [Pseudomonadota bacterium]|nr:hypothetical protein [Pseudomonadota bacterium]